VTNTLTRAGARVTIASVMRDVTTQKNATTTTTNSNNSNSARDTVCVMSRGLKVVADTHISEVSRQNFDLIVLPGPIRASCIFELEYFHVLF
jgi:carbamoylphosphate synthase small subunit